MRFYDSLGGVLGRAQQLLARQPAHARRVKEVEPLLRVAFEAAGLSFVFISFAFISFAVIMICEPHGGMVNCMHSVWMTREPREQRMWRAYLRNVCVPDVSRAASRPTVSQWPVSQASHPSFFLQACAAV